jgi:hypothetical protein
MASKENKHKYVDEEEEEAAEESNGFSIICYHIA